MNKVLAAPNSLKVNRLSAGAATGSQIFHTCSWLYLIAFFILPDGFGFRLGFLWSAKRIMMFICYAMILFSRERLTQFWQDIKSYKLPNAFILLYEFIRVYTAIYRIDLYCIFGSLLDEVMVFYLFAYIFRHEITLEQFIKFVRLTLVILCIEGIWEAATGINLFGYLSFANDKWAVYSTRGGGSRVCGNCHHPIHFGLYLTILFLLSCVDVKSNTVYLFRNPLLFAMASTAVFLTGSRAPLGIYLLCLVLLSVLSKKDERIKSFIFLAVTASVFSLFTMIVYRTEIGRQIMYMLTAMWDAVFDTEYALNYSDKVLRYSTEYREALAKVFDLSYFNKLVGRGVSYNLSVVIDGYWLRSCDNTYVRTYISYAYPGMIMLIGHGLVMVWCAIKSLYYNHRMICSAALTVIICYFLNIWYVAPMGTYMYIWMLFALIYIVYKNQNKDYNLKEEVLK